jgi:hypothetical protein
MSSGFDSGDFIAVGKLAWDLYHDCFLVAQSAPQEFQLLVDELKSLHVTMKLLEDEFRDPDSVLVHAGEDRVRTIKQLLEQVQQTLANLESSLRKHRNLGDPSRSGKRMGWDKIRWSVDAKDVDVLRNKVLRFHSWLFFALLAAYP